MTMWFINIFRYLPQWLHLVRLGMQVHILLLFVCRSQLKYATFYLCNSQLCLFKQAMEEQYCLGIRSLVVTLDAVLGVSWYGMHRWILISSETIWRYHHQTNVFDYESPFSTNPLAQLLTIHLLISDHRNSPHMRQVKVQFGFCFVLAKISWPDDIYMYAMQ